MPVAPRSDGRPGSVTLLAAAGRDAQVAAVAAALHRDATPTLGATGWPLPEQAPASPAPGPEDIALAVVGAHMSGLPLNGELKTRGARFLFASRTDAGYRLYRLPGGPPSRPGLVRDETGAAIAVEVWALPSERLGDFLRGIPSPLCIGTLTLQDGANVHGFLCEAGATIGAEDVTAYGGWRAYLHALASPLQGANQTGH